MKSSNDNRHNGINWWGAKSRSPEETLRRVSEKYNTDPEGFKLIVTKSNNVTDINKYEPKVFKLRKKLNYIKCYLQKILNGLK